MPIITARLDRVFDIAYPSAFQRGHTVFSIECGGHVHYGLTLPGEPSFHDGMVVTAFLEQEHDWQSMRGWRNHATGEIVHSPLLFDAAPIFMGFFFGVVVLSFWQDLNVIVLVLLLGALGIHAIVRRGNVLKQLRNATDMPS